MRVSKWAWAFAVPSFAAAMVLWVMAPRPDTQTAKGADFFTVVTKRGDDVKSLGATCAPKDQVRARFRSSQRYLLIVGVDATGDVQVLYPMGGISSQTLSDTEGLSPGSWELDEKPGTQRFIAFFSEKPLAVSDVTRVIRAKGASTPLLPKVNVVEQRCEKSAP
ncbi:MAG: DUF4384 domain-containing protein [Myxococcaceae bacterium]|nr:DUF4384 domain-containing protein [Myxococcaceae bacterium]